MSCCSILRLCKAVPGQMLWWKVCQYRTRPAVSMGVLKSQEERVTHLRTAREMAIALVGNREVRQKWWRAWGKVFSIIQPTGKKKEGLRGTEWLNDTQAEAKSILFVVSSCIKIRQKWRMWRKQELCFTITDRSHHACSVQSRSFSTVTHLSMLMKGCWIWQAKHRDSHITFCKSCWLGLICIQKYCLCDERDGLSNGETFQCPKWLLSSPLSRAPQFIPFVHYSLGTDGLFS